MLDNFLFIALPYIALLLFVGGTAYRAFTGVKTSFRGHLTWSARGDFLWTTRSTGFFGRASIGPATLSLHWGLFIVIAAHIVGFIGGAAGLPALVEAFRWGGMFGCILLLYGASWALVRRIVIPQLRAMSTNEDYAVLVFLIVITALGLYYAIVQMAFGVSYAAGAWLVSVFTLRPDASLIAGAPVIIKLHMVIALVFLAYVPFTKLVHAFSFPFGYITRPYISMRRYAGLKR
jgi:respiratory nitrate reductase gamma subunit